MLPFSFTSNILVASPHAMIPREGVEPDDQGCKGPLVMNTLRPYVRDLIFHLYNRPLHPELIETLAIRRIQASPFLITFRITPTGHLITWESNQTYLAEVTATSDQLLPQGGRVLHHRFQGEQTAMLIPAMGIRYQMNSQVETLPPEIYRHVHHEIQADAAKRGMLYHFLPHERLSLTPLGYIQHDQWRGNLSIATFHTFPDEWTIVKTQTLIEFDV